ncbi:class I mannose-6-phosphate isomerase [Roseomonas sp. HJA6]|uniref:Class I mannose-6-phosphate isomerase n=1 Tax=Roseomonas alba TaxID=2846776 RepID=A0ABS7AB18_9PROT|nr:class I mannose-6-phosphate isomerase [Neoroseomonas alba]MBW6399270.1 class I mannose-6-phosphate isomerase [Neoroseomonas alba]
MKQAPSRIVPLLIERIWGRSDLSESGWIDTARTLASQPIGEAWLTDVRCRLENGEALGAMMKRCDHGQPVPPLLAKLLFTAAPLSVQVHPTDAAARAAGTFASGKDEAWHVLETAPEASVWIGLRQRVTRGTLRAAAEDGSVLALLRQHAVRLGETILIPAGTVHAIGAGVVLLEVQDPVDITYRLYDYGRLRPLQLEAALAVADLGPSRAVVDPAPGTAVSRRTLARAKRFVLERCEVAAGFTLKPDGSRYHILVALAAGATLDGEPLPPAAAVFVPATGRAARVAGEPGSAVALLHSGPGPSPCLLAGRAARPSRQADWPPA